MPSERNSYRRDLSDPERQHATWTRPAPRSQTRVASNQLQTLATAAGCFWAVLQVVQIVSAWAPTILAAIGLWYLANSRDAQQPPSYMRDRQQPRLTRNRRLRHFQKTVNGYRQKPSSRSRSTTCYDPRGSPTQQQPFVSFASYASYYLTAVQRKLDIVMADSNFLLSALPGYIPPQDNLSRPMGQERPI